MIKKERIIDKLYRKSFEHNTCQASRNGINLCDRPAIGAHCRTGEYAGIANKPDDNLIFPLCPECHDDQERNIGANWWLDSVLKPQMRRRYREWKREMRKGK